MKRFLPAALLILAGLLSAGLPVASAQEDEGEAPPDSLAAAILAAAAAAGDSLSPAQVDSILAAARDADDAPEIPLGLQGVHPIFKSETKALDTRIDLANSLSLNMGYPSTWTVSGNIYYNRSLPRELTREGLEKGFTMSTGRQLFPKVPLQFSASRSYNLDEQNKDTDSYRWDESESDQVNVSMNGGRQFLSWLGANLSTTAGAAKQNNRNNQNLDRSASNLNRMLAGHIDLSPVAGLKVVAGYSGSTLSADAELNKIRDNVQTTQDSLQLRAEYRRGAALVFGLSGGRMERLAETLDFERDERNQVNPDSIVVVDETRNLDVGGRVNLDFKPWQLLEFTGSFTTQQDERLQKLSSSRNTESKRTSLQLQGKLRPWSGQVTDLSYKSGQSRSRDYSAKKRQITKEFFAKSIQNLGGTLKVSGEAFFRLSQDIYVDGKQDRDKLQTRLSATLAGTPLAWLTATSTVQWFEDQDLLIPSTNSVASKDRNSLSWNADLSYNFRNRYKVSQRYEVSVTEEDFYFTPDKNALNTEYTLVTKSKVPMVRNIEIEFEHEFRKRESGSYLPDLSAPGKPKTFFRDSRTKTEILRLGISYRFREYLTILCREEVGRDVDFDYEDRTTDISPNGTLNFVVKFNKKLGQGGNLDASLHHRARFGSFVRENQRSLWLPSLSIGYTF